MIFLLNVFSIIRYNKIHYIYNKIHYINGQQTVGFGIIVGHLSHFIGMHNARCCEPCGMQELSSCIVWVG